MSTKEKLYIIVPAYNEEENLDLIINQWYPIIEDIGEDSRYSTGNRCPGSGYSCR